MSELVIRRNNQEKIFIYRTESKCDGNVVKQIFLEDCFDFSTFAQADAVSAFYKRNIAEGLQPVIIDAGANIGAAAVWFSLSYPQAKIIAVEPANDNLIILHRNALGLDINIVEGGLAAEPGSMFLFDPGIGEWGYRVSDQKTDFRIMMVSGNEIMDRYRGQDYFPFFIKIDIEGAEDNLFSKNLKWLKAFPLIIIELHDWMFPGKANSKNFFRFISAGNYDVVYKGELIFAFNYDLLH